MPQPCMVPFSKDPGLLPSGVASWTKVCRLAESSPLGLLASASCIPFTTAGRTQGGHTLVCPLSYGWVFRLFLRQLSVNLCLCAGSVSPRVRVRHGLLVCRSVCCGCHWTLMVSSPPQLHRRGAQPSRTESPYAPPPCHCVVWSDTHVCVPVCVLELHVCVLV